MADKQGLFTGALYELGDRKTLTSETTSARRALDDVYDDVIEECLEAGSWNFARCCGGDLPTGGGCPFVLVFV